jgi:iron complex outermembrane receptor protein
LGAGVAVIVPRIPLFSLLLGVSLALAPAVSAGRPANPVAAAAVDSSGARSAGAAAHSPAHLDSIVTLPEVLVESERALDPARRRRPTAFVTTLHVDARARGFESVAELLQQAAGVHVVQTGGLGAFSTVSLRGAPAGQVAVYVDGMPMQSAARSVVNLAELPMSDIETIEVYRGGAPLALGVGRPGGAIHLTTGGSDGARGRVTRGSFDTWSGSAGAGATRGALSARLYGGYQGSDGDYSYLNDNGTPFNAADDIESVRRNNRFDMVHGGARLAWQPDAVWRVQAAGNLQRQGQGFPGLASVPALNARARLARGSGLVSIARLLSGDGRIETSLMEQRDRRRFEDAEGRLGLGRHRTDDRFASTQSALRAVMPHAFGVQVEGGLAMRLERASLSDALNGRPDPPGSTRRTRSADAGARWQPWSGPLLLVAAARWDRIEDRLRATPASGPVLVSNLVRETRSPQLGARVALPGGSELRGNWSYAERMPDFMELFGDQGGVAGNPALRPERVESRDAGFAWSAVWPGGIRPSIEFAHFASSGDDFIVYVRQSQTAVKAQNISRAEIRGEELSLSVTTPAGFDAAGAVTWQSAIDDGDVPFWRGRRLPQRPGRESYARLGWRGEFLRASLEMRFVGDSYRDRANQHRVPSRTLVDAALGWTPSGAPFRLTIEGRNLGDRRVSDFSGYPLPGRTLLASIEWQAGR